MLSTLPSDAEIQTIFQTRSRWWETWRQSFGLGWGEDENKTLESFATHAVCTGNPSLLGSLLVCFALSCGDYHRYLTPVEHWILAEDNFSGNAYDFQCIIALGLCLLSALQPSRAWSVFRTATTRLQLAGIHKNHQKSESLDVAFWQIFGADRWVSLLIGLPYSAPDHLYDLEIPEATESSYIKFHYRHLTILAGRVIDVLQSDPPPSLSKLISVEERIDEITAQLPPDYLDIGQILTSPDVPNKSARLYRLTHIHQLKSFLYLPLFLQISGTRNGRAEQRHGVKYGISTCTNSARSFLGAFFTLFDLDPSTAAADNSIKLTALTALCAAVVLYLNSLSSGEKDPSQTDQSRPFSDPDIALVYRVIFILQVCSEGREESLCGQCHQALHKLISCGDEIDLGGSRQISVPCFGIITLMRGKGVEASNISETGNWDPELADTHSHSQAASGGEHIQLENVDPISPLLFDDMFFSYQGPWNPNELEFDWLNQGIDLTSYPCGFSNLDST
ncbi:unnamed protein product [Penicillium salamii]|uniref:Xylanolytic transcriptional activator regulatory domain-containing protein n=1 Tax=Penicillium salamii TaxID=1612424 RepID=A0A9W4NS26_9EURO|nr:unnamed protein product [Penicillium salamii]CAG8191482.1 unnamed protein product [Penicillium salamii]CAG8249702.1 unnamed protein product [Penicillium salamii]CAG8278674.1 unnamed protein product [Penicillium salamii]CAG8310192.1 unnamed protein product [Penicillium salamii]